jgi:hypothetical protein
MYGSAAVNRSTITRQVKGGIASETAKAELHDLSRSGLPITPLLQEEP